MSGLDQLKSFAKSPHHAWLGLLTLGAGLATLSGIGIVAGAAAYALGWIYLPDSRLFKNWLAARQQGDDGKKLRDFLFQRRQIYDALRSPARARYDALAAEIEALQQEFRRDHRLNTEIVRQRNERLSNLAWTFLRLLHTGEMLDRFIESEDPDELARKIGAMEKELAGIDPLAKASLAESLKSRLESLKTRLEKRRGADESRELTASEQERIAELVKLFRADHLASRDAGALSHEIDGAATQLDRTRDWLSSLEFDTSPSDIPEELAAAAPLKVGQ
jgi:cellobiose-specific phosphotransferase system component IIA